MQTQTLHVFSCMHVSCIYSMSVSQSRAVGGVKWFCFNRMCDRSLKIILSLLVHTICMRGEAAGFLQVSVSIKTFQ